MEVWPLKDRRLVLVAASSEVFVSWDVQQYGVELLKA